MFLCNLRSFSDRAANSHHRKQFQQILCETKEVGETRNSGGLEKVTKLINDAQDKCGRSDINPGIIELGMRDVRDKCKIRNDCKKLR